ncbi:hypothetical protein K437DRAFT_269547 [Tilletiaria anomala UBC 951]|uniref:Uncharacterized protein n=1 Tax=Tilletiaria anomala (strain ATCC 24038 / CBS 436.72 / UBC 951) TaxID=1037660 RepID=A0A066VTJ8_TILAU|nr:uncharacterized protein K437DRAFT_269547 [Tilletiaria anomala UBC 951]KDN41860.1 hypothetical protein K437DRAFT_269547 [Tilletiaria anomala UBC 951]
MAGKAAMPTVSSSSSSNAHSLSAAAALAATSQGDQRPALAINSFSTYATATAAKRALQLNTSFTAPEGAYRCVASLVHPSYTQAGSLVSAGLKPDVSGKPVPVNGNGTLSSAGGFGSKTAHNAVFAPNNSNSSAGSVRPNSVTENGANPPTPSTAAKPSGASTSGPVLAPTMIQLAQASAAAYAQYATPLPQISCVSVKYALSKGKEKQQAKAAAAARLAAIEAKEEDSVDEVTLGLAPSGGGTSMGLGIGKVGAGLRRGIGLGGPSAGSGGGFVSGVPAHLQSNASWTRSLIEATLASQGTDFPAQSPEPPIAGIVEYRGLLAAARNDSLSGTGIGAMDDSKTDRPPSVQGDGASHGTGLNSSHTSGLNPSALISSKVLPPPTPSSATGPTLPSNRPSPPLHTLLTAPSSSGNVSSVGRPKNNMRGANSSFVTRLSTHPDFAKILAARNGSGDSETFAFVSNGRTLTWMLDAGCLKTHLAKEPLARFGFSTNITAHDINASTRSASSLDIIIGFQTGDLIWLDPVSCRYTRINKGGVICSSPVSVLRWLPGTEGAFLAAHIDGTIIVYETGKEDSAGPGKETGWFPKLSSPVYVRRLERQRDESVSSVGAGEPCMNSPLAGSFSHAHRKPNDGFQDRALEGLIPQANVDPATRTIPQSSSSPAAASPINGSSFRRPDLGPRTLTSSTSATAASHAASDNGAGASKAPAGLSPLLPAELALLGGPSVLAIADVWNPQAGMLVTRPGVPIGYSSAPNLIDLAVAGAITGPKKEPNWSKLNPISHWRVSREKITGMAFSPDASLLAVTSEDGYLRIIDVQAEVLLDTFGSYFGGFTCVCWSPDGRLLVTGGQDDLITVFAPREGRVLARCQGHTSYVTSVAFDPWRWKAEDRIYRFGSVGEDGKLILWDFSGATLHRPKTRVHGAHSLGGYRASVLGSTFSLVERYGRRGSQSVNDRQDTGQANEAITHAAPLRGETAMLLPILTHQVEGDSIGILAQIRFRPEGIVVLHRDGGVDTFLRPNVPLSLLTAQAPQNAQMDTTTGERNAGSVPAGPLSTRARGLSFGLRKNTSDNVTTVK